MNPNSKKINAGEALVSLIEEELLALPENELDALLRALGIDPKEAVARLEASVKAALKRDAADRLDQARLDHATELGRLGRGDAEISLTHEELYALVKRRSASMNGTLMHRDFSKATAEDLRSILRQLDALEKAKGKD